MLKNLCLTSQTTGLKINMSKIQIKPILGLAWKISSDGSNIKETTVYKYPGHEISRNKQFWYLIWTSFQNFDTFSS